MKQSKIENVIKLNEINCYLTRPDLIELSLSCKKIRKLLSSEVFNSFNFNEFVILGKYKSMYISNEDDEYIEIEKLFSQSNDNEDSRNIGEDNNEDRLDIGDDHVDKYNSNKVDGEGDASEEEIDDEVEDNEYCEDFSDEEEYNTCYILNPYRPLPKSYLESKARFQSDLKQIQYQPTKLNLFNIKYYDYLLYDLPNAFLYVKSLIIKDSSIQLETFQYLLDNLSELEVVELFGSNLNMQEIDKNNYTITWPLNLKKLIIGDSYIGFANYDNDFIATDRFGNFNQECDELSLEPKHLPNLHTLILQSIDPIHERFLGNGEKYFEFLKANCHIIKFDTSFYSLKPEFFEIISKFNNLTELKLSIHYVEDIESFKGFKLPVLANLKNLSLNLYRSLSILPIIAEQFPGIAKLNLTYDFQYYGDVEHIKSFPSEIQAFKSLKVLKLRIFVSYMLCNIDFSKLKYLKSLEILCKEAIEMGDFIRKLENYPDLNQESLSVIKFGEYQFYTKLDFELLLGFKHRPIFRHFPYRLMFYKFNK